MKNIRLVILLWQTPYPTKVVKNRAENMIKKFIIFSLAITPLLIEGQSWFPDQLGTDIDGETVNKALGLFRSGKAGRIIVKM